MFEAHRQTEAAESADRGGILVPQCRTLSGFARETADHDAVALESLAPGTTLVVETRNSRYRMTVLDPADRYVRIEGGALLPIATEAYVQGATSGGSLVRNGWIELGCRMELNCDARRITTSPVRSIFIEAPADSSQAVH